MTALRDPARFPHPVDAIEVVETHISVVVLAGALAYKFKKAVDLGFLDFRRLSSRKHFCEEELRLNRRTAPALYLDVLPVCGTPDTPVLGGSGSVIEYTLRMRRFPQEHLFDRMAREGTLTASHVDRLADVIAGFHGRIERTGADGDFGRPEDVLARALDNVDCLDSSATDEAPRARLNALRAWTVAEYERCAPLLASRRSDGFVRECHGDLHLGNIALVDGAPMPFDCVEFDASLRWTDVVDEVAFLVMDLLAHALPALAWRFLDGYLQVTGDYPGVALLRFCLVYRAMVRAKIAWIRARQSAGSGQAQAGAMADVERCLEVATECSRDHRPAIIVMHGLSGSGKSTVARALVETLGAVRVRSDVERKRLGGLGPGARSASALDDGLYAPAASATTYQRLASLTAPMLAAGWPVVVDATFLRRADRDAFRALARFEGVPFVIATCEASPATLRGRVAARERSGHDASEAGVDVLEHQFATIEPLGADERSAAVIVATDEGMSPSPATLGEIVRRVGTAHR